VVELVDTLDLKSN